MKYLFDGFEYNNYLTENLEFLKEILSRRYKDWQKDTGDCAINLLDSKNCLIFFKIEAGIYIENLPSATSPNVHSSEETQVFTHNVGGEPFKIPSNCLCSEEEAYNIFEYFIINDGKLYPNYEWIDIYSLIENEYE